jgi:hypothetical protein
VQSSRVDSTYAAHDYRRLRGGSQHERVKLLATRLGVLLGIVQARERAPLRERELVEVEEDRGSDERSCEAAPAGLVGSGDVTPLESPVVGEQPAARTRRAALRACRCGLGAST